MTAIVKVCSLVSLMQSSPAYERPQSFKPLPTPAWFSAAYVRDVYTRINKLKAAVTSIYGTILKIYSTKKVCEKFQGLAASTASWATNIGNERGEIVQSVLTSSESAISLKKMAEGLMARYERAEQPPPTVLYTDRDCCSATGSSKYKELFGKWPKLEVRLDIWHFMRRLAVAVTSEAHPFDGVFMARLSAAIFEWDESDYSLLCSAKRGELLRSGVRDPSDSAVRDAITKDELAKHCRRRTRGVAKPKKTSRPCYWRSPQPLTH